MRPKRILLDVDGVLADFVSALLVVVADITGRRYTVEDITAYDFVAALKLSKDEASRVKRTLGNTPGFARKLKPYPGSIEGVAALQKVAEVYIVTSPWNSNPTWTHDREWWLKKYFNLPHSHVIHTSAKHVCAGSMLVDDKTGTLVKWAEYNPSGQAVQWQTGYNRQDGWQGISVDSWPQLVDLINK